MSDPRHFSPAYERNIGPIRDVLRERMPESGCVLEVASGPGQHIMALAELFPDLTWLPSDADPDTLDSIARWTADCPNVLPPIALDVSRDDWHEDVWLAIRDSGKAGLNSPRAILAVNLLHIAPWIVTLGLIRGAATLLPSGGGLYIYGCFRVDGRDTSPSNVQFDRSLQAKDPRWGIRDTAEIARVAEHVDMCVAAQIEMPSNNLMLVLRRL